jgi:hypothetical protein
MWQPRYRGLWTGWDGSSVMGDPKTFWLTVTNILLGAAVVGLTLAVATGVLCEFVARLKKRHNTSRELDRDMREMFQTGHSTGHGRR